ncbi:hypothetical protein AB0950_32100 [Streptomyces sp. NPDC007189]|uniref:hypothetical protein n=1 Tax=Streptomyces sp. NPDC007189 TaxID=3154315 RepID=UPI0034517B45
MSRRPAPRRPTRVDLTGPRSGTDPELMERLTRQVLAPPHTLVDRTQDPANDVVATRLAQTRHEGKEA